MDFRAYARGQFQFTHRAFEQVVADLDEQLLRQASGTLNSPAVIYAHVVTAEDGIVNGICLGRPSIFNAEWAGKTGVPLKQTPMLEADWAKTVRMNLPAFREYAQAVYAATDAAIATMDDALAEKVIDTPFGTKQPVLEFLANLGVTHAWGHMGEIAAIKGAAGLKGLPF